jgi:hypothetical protein
VLAIHLIVNTVHRLSDPPASLTPALKLKASLSWVFQPGAFPLALLVLCILSFGLLIPRLGFYWDDWPMITTIRLQGLSAFWDFYRGERPFSAWTLYASAPFLGTNPLSWHLYTLGVRWLATVAMWWTLRGLWPQRSRQVAWMALLFAIYPVFTQQPVSVAFSQHWITFGLYFLSLGAMVQAYRTPRWFWPLTLLALLASALHIFTMEYFVGLELLRPVILYFILSRKVPGGAARLRSTIKGWLPYLLVLVAFVAWRLLFFKVEGDPNRPDLLYSLSTQPLGTLLRLLQISLQDLINNLVGVWYGTVQPEAIDLSDRAVLLSGAVALITAALVFFYLTGLRSEDHPGVDSTTPDSWIRQAVTLGLLGALLGPLPVWLTDRQAIYGLYSGRFAMAAMFGLSVLFVGLLEWFTPRRIPKLVLIGLLVGLAAGFHVRNATAFYRSSLQQNQFYWQLYWRAPYIKPGTALLSADELFIYVGRAATATAVNLLYPQDPGRRELAYWFLELYHDIGPKATEKLPRGKPLNPQFRIYSFNGSSLDSLAIFYKPAVGRCLWVLSPDDADNPDVPELTRLVLPISNLSRIEAEPKGSGYPPEEIFGAEPEHTWCYYFQKASLASQLGDWQAVSQLGDEADAKGFSPASPHEWLPFIKGYAHSGQWDKALDRTQRALEQSEEIAPRLCRVWSQIQEDVSLPEEAATRVDQQIACPTAP